MEEEREGVTLSRVFGTIFSQKWLALIITLVITIGVTVALFWGYNSTVTEYVSTFTVSFPGGEGANPVFPDNSPFDYREIISRTNLERAKSGNDEKFGYIDIEKLYEERDVSIIRNAGQEEFSYTLRVSAKYFKSRSDASDFIDSLVLMPKNYLLEIASEQAGYLLSYDSTEFFEAKIEILTNQINYLISSTQNLVSSTGNSSSNIQLLNELNAYNTKLKTAIGSMRENLYVHSVEEVRSTYSHQLTVIEDELAAKQREIEIIFGRLNSSDPTVDIVQTSARIEQLAAEISELEQLKQIYSYYLNGKNGKTMTESSEFSAKLVELGTELKALTDKYEVNLGAFYERYTLIAFDGALEKDGNLSIIVCIIIGLIAGLVIAAVTAFIVGSAKQKKTPLDTKSVEDDAAQE